jgi:hypothetical protein
MGRSVRRMIRNFDGVDGVLLGAAVLGGLGGVVLAMLKAHPYWTYSVSALYFLIAVSFLLLRHGVLRGR